MTPIHLSIALLVSFGTPLAQGQPLQESQVNLLEKHPLSEVPLKGVPFVPPLASGASSKSGITPIYESLPENTKAAPETTEPDVSIGKEEEVTFRPSIVVSLDRNVKAVSELSFMHISIYAALGLLAFGTILAVCAYLFDVLGMKSYLYICM
jgi:hypothetical protein